LHLLGDGEAVALLLDHLDDCREMSLGAPEAIEEVLISCVAHVRTLSVWREREPALDAEIGPHGEDDDA
jgi:hypothetical protein